eukprot:Tbor_TRINITY_DN3089_c0_g1::TRINITY_DN3089_c0_g1_i1::g.17386::m.17386
MSLRRLSSHCQSKAMEVVRVIIVGSGASSSTPKIDCITSGNPCKACADASRDPNNSYNHRLNLSLLIQLKRSDDISNIKEGGVCDHDACHHNIVRHTSVVGEAAMEENVNQPHHSTSPNDLYNILIDCGKTFRESVLKIFTRLGVRYIDAVVFTHDHADACFGIDDLREFRHRHLSAYDATGGKESSSPSVNTSIYADRRTLDGLNRMFPYLLPNLQIVKPATVMEVNSDSVKDSCTCNDLVGNDIKSGKKDKVEIKEEVSSGKETSTTVAPSLKEGWVASLDWNEFVMGSTFFVDIPAAGTTSTGASISETPARFPLTSYPVVHGGTYMSNAFLFELPVANTAAATGSYGTRVPVIAYISDVSSLSDEEIMYLKTVVVGPHRYIDTLILDMLSHASYFSHLSVEQAIEIAGKIHAKMTYFVGMAHTIEYTETNRYIEKKWREQFGESGGRQCPMQLAFDGLEVYSSL